jgi:hypothetical protein
MFNVTEGLDAKGIVLFSKRPSQDPRGINNVAINHWTYFGFVSEE